MRFRTLLLIALMLLLAGFVALNFDAVMQMTSLNLGFAEVQAPLGLVMLGMLVAMFAVFLVALLYFQASHAMELRKVTKEASEQRNLADKAEASRFTELRDYLKTELQKVAERDALLSDKLAEKMDMVRTSLVETIDTSSNGLNANLGQIEDRLERQQALPYNKSL
ncbi:MAG: lipopolysaccharide assembly protein LapA domain-containing protein [Hydrogenophaga sp.]